MRTELSKGLKRELRTLIGLGYERSLAAELGKLEAEFARWRAGEIDPFELSQQIHVFHNGPARQLYSDFTMRGMDTFIVAVLIVDGVVAESEASVELLSVLSPEIDTIKRFRSEQ